MQTSPVILMVSRQSGNFDSLNLVITNAGFQCDIRRADGLAMALARLAGGGIDLVVVDVSNEPANVQMESVRKLRGVAPGLAVAVWDDWSEASVNSHVLTGVSGCLTSRSNSAEVSRILSSVLSGVDAVRSRSDGAERRRHATTIAVIGVKGGVGTTTVAMNIATALTAYGSVILAEIRSGFGSLHTYFQPGRMVRGLSNRQDGEAVESGNSSVTPPLWPVPRVPGLGVLFAPQSAQDCGEISKERAAKLFHELAAQADFVVVDLPSASCLANKAIVEASHYLALVLTPSSICLGLAKLTLDGIQSWEKLPASIGTVVVRHTSDGLPTSLQTIESDLGVPILKVIPPATGLCVQGELNHIPLIKCDFESLAAESFTALAGCFHTSYLQPRKMAKV